MDKYLDETHRNIREVLDRVENAFLDGTDSKTLIDLMYNDDVIFVGEGESSAMRGIAEMVMKAESVLAGMGPHPKVSFVIASPILCCEDLAITMIDAVACSGPATADTLKSRMLAGWKKSDLGWRISMEMVTEGSL